MNLPASPKVDESRVPSLVIFDDKLCKTVLEIEQVVQSILTKVSQIERIDEEPTAVSESSTDPSDMLSILYTRLFRLQECNRQLYRIEAHLSNII